MFFSDFCHRIKRLIFLDTHQVTVPVCSMEAPFIRGKGRNDCITRKRRTTSLKRCERGGGRRGGKGLLLFRRRRGAPSLINNCLCEIAPPPPSPGKIIVRLCVRPKTWCHDQSKNVGRIRKPSALGSGGRPVPDERRLSRWLVASSREREGSAKSPSLPRSPSWEPPQWRCLSLSGTRWRRRRQRQQQQRRQSRHLLLGGGSI